MAWDFISSVGIGLMGFYLLIIVLAFAKDHDNKREKK